MDNFSQNMIALRNKHSMTTTQVAQIAGIDKATYEKMELGFEKVSYDVLEKLANFYNVDIIYFNEVHEKEKLQKQYQPNHKVKSNKTNEIITLITSIISFLLLTCLFIPIIVGGGIALLPIDLLGSTGVGVAVILFMMFCALWNFPNSVIFLFSSKISQGKYGLASKIVSLSLTVLAFAFVTFAFVEFVRFGFALITIHFVIYIIALFFEIVKLVLHVKN